MTRRNKTLRTGDKVVLNKDIFRLPNPSSKEEKEAFGIRSMDKWCVDAGISVKQIHPLSPETQYVLYAKKGDCGTIVPNFGTEQKIPSAYLSVLMDDGSKKTFRAGSLDQI